MDEFAPEIGGSERASRVRVLGQGLDILHDEAAVHALSVHDIVIMHTDAHLERVAAHVARLGKKMISIAARSASFISC